MGTRTKYATWRKQGRLFIAKPPDWPRNVEFSCTDQNDLIAWAHNHGYVLKDKNSSREGKHERFAARNFG